MPDLIRQTAAVLRINGERWHALATGLDGEVLARRPAPGEWSALDCLGHTVDTEAAVFAARVRAILAGRDFRAFDPDAEGTPITDQADPAELAARHAELRAASIRVVESVTAADLHRTARHSELGIVSMRELLNEWFAHDTMHLVQAERAIIQPFIAGSGPWRPYFADHDVEVLRG